MHQLFGSVPQQAIRLQALAFSNLRLECDGRLAQVVVTNEMMKQCGSEPDDADALVERARDIKGVEVSAIFKQDGDIWRVSMRSVSDQLDVSKVAVRFGGGGHKMAAAFRWRKSFEELNSSVLEALKELIASQGAKA
jgi:phosphoesterase RecJ-like protein